MTAAPYRFTASARSPRAITSVALWWLLLAVLFVLFNAHPAIIMVLGLFSLPALYEIGAATTSELKITDKEITWRSGKRSGDLPRGMLKLARLDTRLDFSLRLTLITYQDMRIRLPYECVPPRAELLKALNAHDIRHEQHHFSFTG